MATNFLHKGSSEESLDLEKASKPFVEIGQLLTTVAIIVLTIATLVMGIKYMMATPDKKATIKKQLIGLIASALVIFSAYTIWSIAVNLLSESVEEGGANQQFTSSSPNISNSIFREHILKLNDIVDKKTELSKAVDSLVSYYYSNTFLIKDKEKVDNAIEELNRIDLSDLNQEEKEEVEWLKDRLNEIASRPTTN